MKKKTVIVTGASSGIGLAVTKALLIEGYQVVAVSRNQFRLAEALEKLKGDKFLYSCDISNPNEVSKFYKAISKLGSINVLINCAGVSIHGEFDRLLTRDFDEVINTNLKGTFLMTSGVWKQMKKRHQGQIITISSISGLNGYPTGSIYAASKFGVNGLMESLVAEGKECGIMVTNIIPGQVDTNIWNPKDRVVNKARKLMLKPSAIAELIIFLINRSDNDHYEKIIIKPFAIQPNLRGRNKGPGGKFPPEQKGAMKGR